MRPIISIVGRPNVGKSTLFNRIIGRRKAITEDTPGVTRDRNYGEFDFGGKSFLLVDTGGFEPEGVEKITSLVKEHIYAAVEESSMIIFLLDARDGLLPEDREISAILRRYGQTRLPRCQQGRLSKEGGGDWPISMPWAWTRSTPSAPPTGSAWGTCSTTSRSFRKGSPKRSAAEGIKIAIVGRPNTGKSSIVNRLLGSERMIVSDIPGTTRDAIDSVVHYGEKTFTIIDTAGLRRKSRISLKVEEYSVASALRSIERADVVNLVIDGGEGIGHQDATIAHLVVSAGKGIGIVVNKWDLMDRELSEERVQEGGERAPAPRGFRPRDLHLGPVRKERGTDLRIDTAHTTDN